MNKVMQTLKKIWQDESAQGATEYILLLVIVVSLAFIFKDRILGLVREKLDTLGADIGGFTTER